MSEHRTRPPIVSWGVELEAAIASAVPALGASVDDATLTLTMSSGCEHRFELVTRAVVDPATATKLIDNGPGGQRLVVADLVHASAADALDAAGWSFWDRRGRLVIHARSPELHIDRRTPSLVAGAGGPDPLQPVAGAGGLSVAIAHLRWPDDPPGVRAIASMAGMAPSTISQARKRLVDHRLIADGRALVPELFWATSDGWAPRWYRVREPPAAGGWVRAGASAAAAWGAPALAGDERFYALDTAELTRHRLRHAASDDRASCFVAGAPTPLVARPTAAGDDEQLVAPVVAALDLSRDARGQETLGRWDRIVSHGPDTTESPVWR